MTYRVTFYDGPVSCPSCHAKMERRVVSILEAAVTPKRQMIRAVIDEILYGLERNLTVEIQRIYK